MFVFVLFQIEIVSRKIDGAGTMKLPLFFELPDIPMTKSKKRIRIERIPFVPTCVMDIFIPLWMYTNIPNRNMRALSCSC